MTHIAMASPNRAHNHGGMAEPHDFGRRCESLAAAHLTRLGWRIVARNYRCGHREIDLIARRGDCIAFVEVKGRRAGGLGDPLDAITRRKRREIERVARHWLVRFGHARLACRFDAISVEEGPGPFLRLRHIENAWRVGD
jgi:putative endonuclease